MHFLLKVPNACKTHSVQFSHSVVSHSLRPYELQHARPPCPSPTPGVYPNSCPSSRWCHPSPVIPFSSCPQSLPAIRVFSNESTFAWGGQRPIGLYYILCAKSLPHGMGEFNSDDHYIYYCGQESLRRNGIAVIVNKRFQNAVLSCNLKNNRMNSVCFQGKPFSITVIQVYAPASNAEEAEVELLYEDLQRRQWQPTPVLLPGKSHGQRSLVVCCLWGCTELDMTEAT